MVVLENDEFWAIYGTQTSTAFLVAGFLQGQGASNNGTFSSTNVRDFGFVPALAGTASGTYDATAGTISGAVTAPAGTVTFSGGPIPGSLYNYNAPASLAALVGAWTLSTLTGETVALTVAAGGAFAATSSLGCSFSGSMTPRSSGKNVFNVTLVFGGFPCSLANQSASGIALAYPLANGRTQVIIAGMNGARTVGTAAFGTR